MNSYLRQKAAPWVTIAVLVGGLCSTLILFLLQKIEADAVRSMPTADYIEETLEK